MGRYELKKPRKIQLYPTNRCSLNCKFCDSSTNSDFSEELDLDKWNEVFEDIKKLSPKRLIVSGGGEPLERKELMIDIFKTFQGTEIKKSLITNGVLLNESIIRKIVNYDWNHISFSIHSPFAKKSDYIRGSKGSSKKTIQNIRLLEEIKEERGSKTPTTSITTVINEYNSSDLLELKEFAKELDIGLLVLRPLQGNKSELKSYGDPKVLRGLLTELQKSNYQVKREFNLEDLSKDNKSEKNTSIPYCLSPFFEVVISADGKVSPCCFFLAKNYQGGLENVGEKNLEDIWRGDVFEEMRDKVISNKIPEICKECILSGKDRFEFEDYFAKKYSNLYNRIRNNFVK